METDRFLFHHPLVPFVSSLLALCSPSRTLSTTLHYSQPLLASPSFPLPFPRFSLFSLVHSLYDVGHCSREPAGAVLSLRASGCRFPGALASADCFLP